MVFESTKEDLAVKLDVNRKIAESLPAHAIACSGTSGLSITTLTECFPNTLRSRYFGVHMFNPPYSMTLCEVTPTKYSDRNVIDQLKEYLRTVLFRTVVEVKDSPAFLGNRIGFQFINEALQYAEHYQDNGGIDYIDAILGPYTGRSMSPLTTSDFVGLDVHKAIVNNLYVNTNDYAHGTFILPDFAQRLINSGRLGRKAGSGMYKMEKYDGGLKRLTVYDISTQVYRDKMNYVFPYAEKMIHDLRIGDYESAMTTLVNNRSLEAEICLGFLLRYIIYSLGATEAVGYDIHSADDVIASGYNWCPPLALIQALSTVANFNELVKNRLDKSILDSVDVDHLLKRVEPSRYDYRRYFKSAK